MRGTTTFDLHASHAWLHFLLRLIFILSIIILGAWLTEAAML